MSVAGGLWISYNTRRTGNRDGAAWAGGKGLAMAILVTVLAAAHLLAVNLASAGPLVCVWLHGRGRRGDEAASRVGRQLAWASFWALAVGIGLGAILLAMAWAANQGYWDAVRRFPPRQYVYAGAELVFAVVCLAVYVGTWERWRRRPWLHALVAVAAATDLWYHFPPLLTVLSELAVRPELVGEPTLTHAAYRSLIVRPDVLAHVVHFVFASVAVSGVALMWLAEREEERGREAEGGRLVRSGARIALVVSGLQLVVGVAVLLTQPAMAQSGLVGGDWLAVVLLFVSLAAVFALLHALAAVAIGDASVAAVQRAAATLVIVVLLMTAMLARTRYLSRPDGPVSGVVAARLQENNGSQYAEGDLSQARGLRSRVGERPREIGGGGGRQGTLTLAAR